MMKRFLLAGLFGSVLPVLSLSAQEPKAVAPGAPRCNSQSPATTPAWLTIATPS